LSRFEKDSYFLGHSPERIWCRCAAEQQVHLLRSIPKRAARQKENQDWCHGQITAEEARALARKHLSSVTQGEDPAKTRQTTKNLPFFQELGQDYLERHASTRKRPKSYWTIKAA